MKAKFDYHIHTHHLGCANETMKIEFIVGECLMLGLESIAITDHLNYLEQVEFHKKIKEELAELETELEIYFGVEISCFSENPYNRAIKEELGFSFAIAGVHNAYEPGFNSKQLLSEHHRRHMKAMEDPLVDILAHPYLLFKSERAIIEHFEMTMIPDSWITELAAASRETGTAIEINAQSIFHNTRHSQNFKNSYRNYLQKLSDAGAIFSLGSDAHDLGELKTIQTAWDIAEELGLLQSLWQPKDF